MRTFGYLVALVFFVLACGILSYSWKVLTGVWGQGLNETSIIQVVQIAMAFIGAILTAILTATLGRSTEYLKANLSQSTNKIAEQFKADLAVKTGIILEDHRANMTKVTTTATEEFKAGLTKIGDVFRSELSQLAPRRHAAYHSMWAALNQFFRAVQKFEAGVFDTSALDAAEKACNDATGLTLLVEKEDETAFHRFWQELNYVHESGESKKDLPDGLRTIWRNEGRQIGERYEELRTTFGTRLRG